MVLLAVGAAEQLALGRNVQGDVALDLDGSDYEHAGRYEHGPALIAIAGINRGLQCCRIEGHAVALRAEVADVVNACAPGADIGGRSGVLLLALRERSASKYLTCAEYA